MGSVVQKTPVYELFFINLGKTPLLEHVVEVQSPSEQKLSFLPLSCTPLHREILKSMEKQLIFLNPSTKPSLAAGKFLPNYRKKTPNPKIKNLLMSTQRHDAHLVQG